MKTTSHSELTLRFALITGLVLVTFLLNYTVLSAHWRWDDTQILWHNLQYPIIQDFTRPEVWQQFSPANLTPWLTFSFKVDLTVFGLSPAMFYLRQIVAVALAAAALFLCFTLWGSKRFGFLAAVLFLVGAPSQLVTEQLMTRHYVEGLVFCLLALYCFVLAIRHERLWWLCAAVLFYVLAVTAKEIYVPLVLLLPFLPEGSYRRRLMSVWPFVLAAGLYTLWRGYMLGALGGYADSSAYLSFLYISEVLHSFSQFPHLLFGSFWPVFVSLYLALLVSYALSFRSTLLLSLLVAALVLLPLVPLVSSPGITSPDRYLFLLWAAISFSVAFYADKLTLRLAEKERVGAVLLVYAGAPVMLAVSMMQSNEARAHVAMVGADFDVHSEFVWEHTDSVAFVPSETLLPSFWFVTGLVDFKQLLTGRSSPLPIVDEIYLDEGLRGLFQYDRSCQCMLDVSGSIPQRLQAHEQRLREKAPLSLIYSYQQADFTWEFGPYAEGSYHVVSDVLGVIPLPASGRQRVTLEEGAPFYLRYTSPEGWQTYSTLQRIRHNAPPVVWRRNQGQTE